MTRVYDLINTILIVLVSVIQPLQLRNDGSVVGGNSFVEDSDVNGFPLLSGAIEDEVDLFVRFGDRDGGKFLAIGEGPLLLEKLEDFALWTFKSCLTAPIVAEFDPIPKFDPNLLLVLLQESLSRQLQIRHH